MDVFERNIVELYRREAQSGQQKSLTGYRLDPLFSLIPDDVKCLSQGLWHPLMHEAFAVDGQRLKVLDAGCGGGFDLYYLNMKYPGYRYVGIDLSPELLARGRATLARNGFHPNLVNGNLRDLPFTDGAFNRAYSHAVIHLSRRREQVIGELFRVLGSPGVLLVCEPVVNGTMPEFFREEYETSGGIFLYGGLTGLDEYQTWSEAAGFSHFDLMETVPFKPHATIRGMLEKCYGTSKVSREELEQMEFSIATFALIKGEKWGRRRLQCSSCGSLSVINYCAVINCAADQDLSAMVFQRRLNFGMCRSCGSKLDCPYPFFYIRRDGLVLNKRPERFRMMQGSESCDYSASLPGMKVECVYGQDEFFKLAEGKR